jgi:two-component system sensor histidine kinase/response regulator
MPEMDGYTAAREIRAREDGERIPIIAVTADVMKDACAKSLAADMDDYVTKPIDAKQLAVVLARWVPEPRNPLRITESRDFFDPSVIEKLRMLERAGTPGPLRKVFEAFAHDTAVRLGDLREAVRKADGRALATVAHALKGSSLNVGATRVAAVCATWKPPWKPAT